MRMSSAESRKRIAVVIPKYRIWLWQRQVISSLQESFDVVTYVSSEAVSYPLFVRIWLAFENALLGGRACVQTTTIFGQTWPPSDNNFFFILNLSESPIGFSEVPIIESRFDNSLDSLSLFAAIVDQNSPLISFQLVGSTEPLVASYLAIPDKTSLGAGLQRSFARLTVLAERATKHLLNGSRAAMLPPSARASSTLSVWRIVAFSFRFFSHRLGWFFRGIRLDEHWSIGVLWGSRWDVPNNVPLMNFTKLQDDGKRYYADPFILCYNGATWLFAEELGYKDKKGVISCGELRAGETEISFRPVLARPYHLSYPFVFQHGDEVYMMPESGSSRKVELYRARTFPLDWILDRIILEDLELYDSTLLNYRNMWWIFGAVVHKGGSDRDELAIFYSEQLGGCWRPHALNPVKSDCRSARPAGRIIVVGDRLLRPAQDCENGYGMGVVWLEILELTPDNFNEREIARWPGSAAGAQGLHTFDCQGELAVIDTRCRLTRLKAAFAW
jgi:hypothetical protein